MVAATAKKPAIPISSKMLSWARGWAGVSIEAAAKRVGVESERVQEWEKPESGVKPTVRQARELADLYGRQFVEFFRGEPPPEAQPSKVPDFRLHRGAEDPTSLREMRDIRVWAEAQRENALTLFEEVGEDVPAIPASMFVSMRTGPETAAKIAREKMGFPIEEQVGRNINDRRLIPNIIRVCIEPLGILCLKHTRLSALGTRGFCLAVFPLPIIVFGNEAASAQAFTLLHELAHVMLKSSAISGPINRSGRSDVEKQLENWCDQFAGAFLMPEAVVNAYMPRPNAPAPEIADERLAALADYFGVSRHAALIRLLHLQYVDPKFYWGAQKAQFEKEESEYRGFGRATYYGSRFRNALGDLYTGLVIDAWSRGKITNHHAAEYMGIENLAHLRDIRENF